MVSLNYISSPRTKAQVLMRNARTLKTPLTLKENGFTYIHAESKVDFFANDFNTQAD